MKMSDLLHEANAVYDAGQNIIAHFSARDMAPLSQQDLVLVSYDLQAGSYTDSMADPAAQALKSHVGERLSALFKELGAQSVCEAGVGEATTLRFVAERAPEISYSAFDISLSRLLYARRFMAAAGAESLLFSANLLEIPLVDNAADLVFTFHALEPNGGREDSIIAELARVARRYLVLVEPDYMRASDAQRARMEKHGYIRTLRQALQRIPGQIILDEPWGDDVNPLNAASLIIFEKADVTATAAELRFVSPSRKAPLIAIDGGHFCPAEGLVYPTVMTIPLLQQGASQIASRLGDFL